MSEGLPAEELRGMEEYPRRRFFLFCGQHLFDEASSPKSLDVTRDEATCKTIYITAIYHLPLESTSCRFCFLGDGLMQSQIVEMRSSTEALSHTDSNTAGGPFASKRNYRALLCVLRACAAAAHAVSCSDAVD